MVTAHGSWRPFLLLCVVAAAAATVAGAAEWDATYADKRFTQRYRVHGSKLCAENVVAINVPTSRLRSELASPWTWWAGGVVTPTSNHSFDFYPTGRFFHTHIALGPVSAPGLPSFSLNGTATGAVQGAFDVLVEPHARIANRSLVTVRLRDFESHSWLLGADLLGRGVLWAMRGDMSWPFDQVKGLWGLIRKLEGHLGQRHDLVDDAQLDQWMSAEDAAMIWAPRLDSTDEEPSVASRGLIDAAAILRGDSGAGDNDTVRRQPPQQLLAQFLLTLDDDDEEDDFAALDSKWAPGSVRVSFLTTDEDDSLVADAPLSLAIVDSGEGVHQRQVFVQLLEGSVGARVFVGHMPPAPPGQARHFALTLGANWTLAVAVDGVALHATPLTLPVELRDELAAALQHVGGVALRNELSNRRVSIDSLLLTDDAALHESLLYFALNRAASLRDAHSLASAAPVSAWAGPPISGTGLLMTVAVLVLVPLGVARLASFDSAFIPTKGFDRPLLYARIAPFLVAASFATGGVAALCLVLHLAFHSWLTARGFPSVVAALTHRSPEALLWRLAVVLLVVKRLAESYLSFATQIDKLSEKRVRVAKPLFDCDYWMWVNRVSLVADVLETASLLLVSLCSPVETPNLQLVGSVLFAAFHVIHTVSYFWIFAEIKRVQQDELVGHFRKLLSVSLGVLLSCIAFHVLRATVASWPWIDSLAALAEWSFFAMTFVWRWNVARHFVEPEDTRIYLGRRVALGAATRCSECFRPFSYTRPRESCADCRDECCLECGSEVHLSEMGSLLDMTCFFCNKCHNLLVAEVAAVRAKLEGSGTLARAASLKAGARPRTLTGGKRVPVTPTVLDPALVTGPLSPAGAEGAVEVCRLYKRGECTYGDACKFLHVDKQASGRSTRAGSSAKSTAAAAASVARANVDNGRPSPPLQPPTWAAAATPPPPQPVAPTDLPLARAFLTTLHREPVAAEEDGSLSDASDVTSAAEDAVGGGGSSSLERKKKRRGKRGQRRRRPGGTSSADGTEADGEGDGEDDDDEKKDAPK